MTLPYLASKSNIYSWINDQLDALKSSKILKLSSFPSNGPLLKNQIAEIIECIHEFLYSCNSPIEIETISMSNKHIDELPENILIIGHNVKYFDIHSNNLTLLPMSLQDFKNLEILDISSNKIWQIPNSIISNLPNLRVLSLKDNKFKYLPPTIGELENLNFLEVADNPLVLPPQDLIKSFQKQRSGLDWVVELKNYLVANKSILNQKSAELFELRKNRNETIQNQDETIHHTGPSVSRSMSASDTRSSRASRRMGLIIKKNDRSTSNSDDITEELESNSSSFLTAQDASILSTSNDSSSHSFSQPSHENSFQIETPPPVSASVPTSQATSPNQPPSVLQHSKTSNSLSNVNSNSGARLTRPIPTRQRSNTLKEIDRFMEKNEVDTENKSSAYFRRLSTLQELPSDESNASRPESSNVNNRTQQVSLDVKNEKEPINQNDHDSLKQLSSLHLSVKSDETPRLSVGVSRSTPIPPHELSPTKIPSAKKHSSTAIIKVSRKILFAFSELHSSVRRFSGFCGDKKVRYKMVSYLYTTKSNVDTLVENLEIMEEHGNNIDQIVTCLRSCITSFKAMMTLLTDNFQVSVKNIDLCFIRMLYLTIYGSTNELLNAYRILVPNSKPPQFNVPITSQAIEQGKPKLPINTNSETDEVDEKLYRAIDVATTNAKDVFSELTRAIGTSVIASTDNSTTINPTVAKHVKELTSICMASMEITKNLKIKLVTIRNNPSMQTKRGFWDDINSFLKAIIQTFQTVKGIMQDLPILNEIRGSMSTLTKNTKDLTVLLEVSSYKSMSSESNSTSNSHPPQLISIPSVSNIFTPVSSHPTLSLSQLNLTQLNTQPVRTPLAATLGAAAQAIMPTINSSTSDTTPLPTNFNTSILSPPALNSGPTTVPVNSSGQYFAKNGINPFDGLIMKNREDKLQDPDK